MQFTRRILSKAFRDRFTIHDDSLILQSVLKNLSLDSKQVAAQLDRSPSSIQTRWKSVLLPSIRNMDVNNPLWNTQEERILLQLTRDKVHLLEQLIEKKGKGELSRKYTKSKYNVEEDKMIMDAVESFGMDWKFISNHVLQSRSSFSIKNRYLNHLNPYLSRNEFTQEEDSTMAQFMKEYPKIKDKWSHIATHVLPNRSPLELSRRWVHLNGQKRPNPPLSLVNVENLKKGIDKYGFDFESICEEFFPHLSRDQLYSIWVSCMYFGHDLFCFTWTPVLDQLLIDLVKEHSYSKFSSIHRTYFQNVPDGREVYGRYLYLLSHVPVNNSQSPTFNVIDTQIYSYSSENKSSMSRCDMIDALTDKLHIPYEFIHRRFCALLKPHILYSREWTNQEDDLLCSTIHKQSYEYGIVKWTNVSKVLNLPMKTCQQRWDDLQRSKDE